jgi:hypothetical protein
VVIQHEGERYEVLPDGTSYLMKPRTTWVRTRVRVRGLAQVLHRLARQHLNEHLAEIEAGQAREAQRAQEETPGEP